MNYSPYHWCLVSKCKNTSVKTPGKLWIQVPTDLKMRNAWLKLARRDPNSLSTKTKYYFCEDHFDLEYDMENYTQYKIMGSVKRIRMKPNCVPSRFDCQPDRKRKFTQSEARAAFMKRQRLSIIKEIEEAENEASDTPLLSSSQGTGVHQSKTPQKSSDDAKKPSSPPTAPPAATLSSPASPSPASPSPASPSPPSPSLPSPSHSASIDVAQSCEVDSEDVQDAPQTEFVTVADHNESLAENIHKYKENDVKQASADSGEMSFRILPKPPHKVIWLKPQSTHEKVLACRGCLATNIQLFDLKGSNLKNTFADLTGTPIKDSDILPQYLCTFCVVLLRKFKEFREKCLRAQDLLNNINGIKMLNTKFIKSVDRPYYNLNLNLEISNPVIMESDYVKEEIENAEDKPIDIIKQEDHEMQEYETLDETNIENNEIESVVQYVVENDDHQDNESEGENIESIQMLSRKTTKVFDKKALEEEYNMDIVILTEEEQVLEIESRKQSQNYLKSNHRCESCGKGFMSSETLQYHYNNIHHPDLGDFLCLLCKGRFDSITKLTVHMNNHKYRFSCRECDFTTMRRWSANKHRNKHQGTTYTCEPCNKEFSMHTSYLSHMRLHHPTEGVWCRYCGDQFISELGLRTHKRLKHSNISITEFICQICGMTFLNEEAVTIHNSNGCSQNACAQCGKSFNSDKDLQVHVLQTHSNTVKVKTRSMKSRKEKPRKDLKKCELCDNFFNSAHALDRHNEMMAGACGGMRACVECGESFLTGDMLKEHVIDNHADVEMLCPRCNRTFESSAEFNEHYKRVHMKKGPPRLTGTKTWGVMVNEHGPVIAEKGNHQRATEGKKNKGSAVFCEHCGKQCASNLHLTYHLRIHTGEKPYKCAICQKAFAVPKFLKEHFKVHTGERPFDCESCNKAFKSKSALNRHKLCHTGERRHICQICSKDFLTSSDVKTHIKTVHMKITGPPRIRKPKDYSIK